MLFLLFVLGFAIGMHSEVRTDESYAAAMTAPTPTATSSSPVDLAQAAAAAGYDAALIRRLERAELPSVVLETGRGASRIGGDPDLPRGTAWPTCHGRPQTFLAEIRVSELPRAGARAAPARRHAAVLHPGRARARPGRATARRSSTRSRASCAPNRRARPCACTRAQLGLRLRQDIPGPKLDDDYAMPPLADVVADDTLHEPARVTRRRHGDLAPPARLPRRAQRRQRLLGSRRARPRHLAAPVHAQLGRGLGLRDRRRRPDPDADLARRPEGRPLRPRLRRLRQCLSVEFRRRRANRAAAATRSSR